MAHLDKNRLSTDPIDPGKTILFSPDDFLNEDQVYVVMVKSDDKDPRPYCFEFADGYMDFVTIIEQWAELKKYFVELGVISEDYLDNPDADMDAEVVAVRTWRGDDKNGEHLFLYIYNTETFEFILNCDHAAMKRPVAIIEIPPSDSVLLVKSRLPVGYDVVPFFVEKKSECNGGSFEEYNGC